MSFEVLVLLMVYQFKHLLADYFWQTEYMLQKGREGWDFLKPLASHCAIHAIMTFAIACYVNPKLWWLCFFDFAVHFTMDRIKAGPRYLGQYKNLAYSEIKECKSHLMDSHLGYLMDGEDTRKDYCARQRLRGNTRFWRALGVDQMVHHITHYSIIYLLVTQ